MHRAKTRKVYYDYSFVTFEYPLGSYDNQIVLRVSP
jgi:hypothetical protein